MVLVGLALCCTVSGSSLVCRLRLCLCLCFLSDGFLVLMRFGMVALCFWDLVL